MNTLTVQINDFLYYIGVNDRDTSLFENQWPLDNGVSYNSYLVKAEKTALMDTVKITKVDQFAEKLDEALDHRDLDYIVIHHMEPDHSGSIDIIRSLYPNAQLVGNKKTAEFLTSFYGIQPEEVQVVGNGDSLDLGDRKLTFYTTPMVHWPESMVSFEEESGILFSQDIFGGFGALDGPIFDDEINWSYFANETSRYYTNIVGKYSKQAQNALKKLGGLDIKMICPVHGPVWRSHPETIIDMYDRLSSHKVEEGVVIAYGSMYGNTAQMAETIARQLAVEGIKNVKIFDVSKTHTSYIQNEMWKYRGIILGSCTYNNALFPPMKNLVGILEENKMENHVIGIFGSYSWSGGAVKGLKEFADSQKFDQLETVVEMKSAPNAEILQQCQQLAKEMANYLTDKRFEDVGNMLGL